MRIATSIFLVQLDKPRTIKDFLGAGKTPDKDNLMQLICLDIIRGFNAELGFSYFSFKNADFVQHLSNKYDHYMKSTNATAQAFTDFIAQFSDKDIHYLLWDFIYYSNIDHSADFKTQTVWNESLKKPKKCFFVLLTPKLTLEYIDSEAAKNLDYETKLLQNPDFTWSNSNGHKVELTYQEFLHYEDHRNLTLNLERRAISHHTREFEIDRFRVLFSDDFRRLAEVTQVVSPDNNYIFHNRLTHSLEVAQIGRRIAEMFLRRDAWTKYRLRYSEKNFQEFSKFMYSNYWAARIETKVPLYRFLDPNVVETAGLLHDIGHPPFGHVCETELDRLGKWFFEQLTASVDNTSEFGTGKFDAFEGNAQSFRIVTILSAQQSEFGDFDGLKLSTATLLAIVKYPWLKQAALESKRTKYNAYGNSFRIYEENSRLTEFYGDGMIFKKLYQVAHWREDERTLEAEIMNYADDIAYSIQDIYDFYKAGIFNLDQIVNNNFESDFEFFFSEFQKKSYLGKYWDVKKLDKNAQKNQLKELLTMMSLGEKYNGNPKQRADVKRRIDFLLQWFMFQVKLDYPHDWNDKFDKNLLLKHGESITYPFFSRTLDSYFQIEFLKSIFMKYFIASHKLKSKQVGIKNIVKQLFFAYFAATNQLMDATQTGNADSMQKERSLYSISEIDYDHVANSSMILPPRFYQIFEILKHNTHSKDNNGFTVQQRIQLRIRLTIDAICSLSDAQAMSVYRRLRGIENNEFLEQSDLTQN
jgi:dGTPase